MAQTSVPAAVASTTMTSTGERARPKCWQRCVRSTRGHAPPGRRVVASFCKNFLGACLTRRLRAGIPASTASTTTGAVSEQQRGVVGSVGERRGWKDVVCPMGGPHEWEFMHRGGAAWSCRDARAWRLVC